MQKKHIVLATALAAALIAYACALPTVEIKTDKLKIGVPINVKSFDMAKILSERLADSFPEGVEFYDMINYKDAQAFLVSYKMLFVNSFNPDDYLNNNSDITDIAPIQPDPIKIPQITPDIGEAAREIYWFSMKDFLGDIDDKIDFSAPPVTVGDLFIPPTGNTIKFDWPSSLPSITTWDEDENDSVSFNSVVIGRGEITLNITSKGMNPQTTITLGGIGLRAGVISIGSHVDGKTQVVLNGNSTDTITIDLAGEEIFRDNPPQFVIDSIEFNNAGTLITDGSLTIEPQIDNIKLRGAKGLKITKTEVKLDENLTVPFNELPDGFINAQISVGSSFDIGISLPEKTEENHTYMKGAKISYNITVKQDPYVFESKGFEGMDITLDEASTPEGLWINKNDLSVETSGTTITISQEDDNGIDFELFDDDQYHDNNPEYNAFEDMALPVLVKMAIDIKRMEMVHWKMDDEEGNPLIPAFDVPEIDFGNIGGDMGDISEFITSITFEKIALGLDFTLPAPPPFPPPNPDLPGSGLHSALEGRLAVMVHCPELGFNRVIEVLDSENSGDNPYLNQFARNHTEPVTLKLKDPYSFAGKKIKVEVEIWPTINKEAPTEKAKYIEIGPLMLNDNGEETEINLYANASIDFKWTEADVNLNKILETMGFDSDMLTGSYPEKEQDWFNLHKELSPLMSGVSLSNNIQTKLYLGGPAALLDKIPIKLDLNAEYQQIKNPGLVADDPANWEPGEPINLFNGSLTAEGIPQLVTDEDKALGIYRGTSLPPGGTVIKNDFNKVLAKTPKDLRLAYNVTLPPSPFTVTQDMFDNVADTSDIEALVAIIIPLEFAIEPGGYFSVPNDDFKDENGNLTDIFGRETIDDPVFNKNLNVTSLKLTIDFRKEFFNGAFLHIDGGDSGDGGKFFGENGLAISNSGNISIALGEDYMKKVHTVLIYPDIKIVFPRGATLPIHRDFLPTRITVSASGSYKLDLNELGQ